jgi:hypothetical protein
MSNVIHVEIRVKSDTPDPSVIYKKYFNKSFLFNPGLPTLPNDSLRCLSPIYRQ